MKIKPLLETNFSVNNRGTNTNGSGDYSGKDFYIGGPWGFSNQRQLANPKTWSNLKDPEQELEDFYNPLRDENPDNNVPLNKLDNPGMYDEGTMDPARQFYNYLPGMKSNLLANQRNHIPRDHDPMRDFSEEEADKNGERPEYWPPNEPLNAIDPIEEELNLLKKSNTSINNWKTTTQANRGYAARSVSMNQLVVPSEYTPLDSEEDVETGVFSMGKIVSPKRQVPLDKSIGKIKYVIEMAVKEGLKK